MKYNVDLLTADILDELEKIERIEEEFSAAEDKLSLPADKVGYYDRGAIGYILHNFFNGCENIFRSIARFFENDIGPQTWHRDLLRRMKVEIPGYRPRVIDDELYLLLDDFRAFRHKFRHTYSFELDWERERMVAGKFQIASTMFKNQIRLFLKALEQI